MIPVGMLRGNQMNGFICGERAGQNLTERCTVQETRCSDVLDSTQLLSLPHRIGDIASAVPTSSGAS